MIRYDDLQYEYGVVDDTRIIEEPISNASVTLTLDNLIDICGLEQKKHHQMNLGIHTWIGYGYTERWCRGLVKYTHPSDYERIRSLQRITGGNMSTFVEDSEYETDGDEDENLRVRVRRVIIQRPNKIRFDIIIEKTPKGGGKTQAAGELILHEYHKTHGNLRVAMITCRRTLTVFLKNSMNDVFIKANITARFESYMDYGVKPTDEQLQALSSDEERAEANRRAAKRYLGDIPLIIIQADSMGRLEPSFPNNQNIQTARWNITFLDEFKSFLRHVSSGFIKDKRGIVGSLVNLFLKSEKVVILDADMDADTLKIINLILNGISDSRNVRVSINSVRFDKRPWHQFPSPIQIRDKLISKLEKGKKILFPTNSKIWAEIIEWCAKNEVKSRQVKVLTLTTDTIRGKDKTVILDSRIWKEYDLIIYTGVVTVGVSYDVDDVDAVMSIFVRGSNGADECAQMVERGRKTKKVYFYAAGNMENEEYTAKILELRRNLAQKYEEFMNRPDRDRWVMVNGITTFLNDIYTYIWMFNEVSKRSCMQNLSREITAIIKRYLVDESQLVKHPLKRSKLTKISEIKDILAIEKCKNIANATMITAEEAEKLGNKRDDMTLEESWSMDKFKLMKFYNVIERDCTWKFVRHWKSKMHGIRNFLTCFVYEDNTLKTNDERNVSNTDYDTLIHVYLTEDLKKLCHKIFEMIGLQMDRINTWSWSITGIYGRTIDYVVLNDILPKYITHTSLRLPTRVTNENMDALVRKLLQLCGIPFVYTKASQTSDAKVLRVDLPDLLERYLMISRKFDDNETIRRRIKDLVRCIDVNAIEFTTLVQLRGTKRKRLGDDEEEEEEDVRSVNDTDQQSESGLSTATTATNNQDDLYDGFWDNDEMLGGIVEPNRDEMLTTSGILVPEILSDDE